ncbi:MAG: 50S ribosomal protein L22 [Bacteroidetes bacterium]|nr:50S ribosomal protein L22 [Bacteroidota bacterium]
MGVKSRTRAENRKEAKKKTAVASLQNNPTSPRKARLVADLIRGKRVELALNILKNTSKQPSEKMRKLLLSAISNWQLKNEGLRIEDADLFVQEIKVDVGRTLKRINTAPQGRAHRIRKRSNHITITLGSKSLQVEENVEKETKESNKE